MGMNNLGEKKLRILRDLTGLNIDRAVTNSAFESGRWWEFRVIEEDGHWHGYYDRYDRELSTNEDGSLYHGDQDPGFRHWSTCGDLS
jgi:hypothetical protein